MIAYNGQTKNNMKVNISSPPTVKSQFTKPGHIYSSGGYLYMRLKENSKFSPILSEDNSYLFLNLGVEYTVQTQNCYTAMIKHNVVMDLIGEAEIKTVE